MLSGQLVQVRAQTDDEAVLYRIAAELDTWEERTPAAPTALTLIAYQARVHLVVLASNTAAISSCRRVGFVEEGRRREHCWVRGQYEDEVVMGLLRADWRSLVGDLDRA